MKPTLIKYLVMTPQNSPTHKDKQEAKNLMVRAK